MMHCIQRPLAQQPRTMYRPPNPNNSGRGGTRHSPASWSVAPQQQQLMMTNFPSNLPQGTPVFYQSAPFQHAHPHQQAAIYQRTGGFSYPRAIPFGAFPFQYMPQIIGPAPGGGRAPTQLMHNQPVGNMGPGGPTGQQSTQRLKRRERNAIPIKHPETGELVTMIRNENQEMASIASTSTNITKSAQKMSPMYADGPITISASPEMVSQQQQQGPSEMAETTSTNKNKRNHDIEIKMATTEIEKSISSQQEQQAPEAIVEQPSQEPGNLTAAGHGDYEAATVEGLEAIDVAITLSPAETMENVAPVAVAPQAAIIASSLSYSTQSFQPKPEEAKIETFDDVNNNNTVAVVTQNVTPTPEIEAAADETDKSAPTKTLKLTDNNLNTTSAVAQPKEKSPSPPMAAPQVETTQTPLPDPVAAPTTTVSPPEEQPKPDDVHNAKNQKEQEQSDKENVAPPPLSPQNPDDKKLYSRDQLLTIREVVVKEGLKPKVKPGLEPMDFWLEPDKKRNDMDGRRAIKMTVNPDMLMPRFASQKLQGRGMGGGGGPYSKRPSQQSNKDGRMQMGGNKSGFRSGEIKIISLKRNSEVKLNEAVNAWKPPTLSSADGHKTEEERETDELYRKFRSILNKLTPENFAKLVAEVKQSKIDTIERLNGCIRLVFEKAIAEPNYAKEYALMCKELSTIHVNTPAPKEGRSSRPVYFKSNLLNQCQQEFEKHRQGKSGQADKNKLILDEKDTLKRDQMKEAYEEEQFKLRRRAVGTVRFIGELYKIEMLNDKIMHECVKLLLDNEDEDSLECLCKLLTTIGKDMEQKTACLEDYFRRLSDIANKKSHIKVCSRILFMIKDLIDLRKNDWKPRRTELVAKTMGEIQKEAETEQQNIEIMNSQVLRRNDRRGGNMTGDRRDRDRDRDGGRDRVRDFDGGRDRDRDRDGNGGAWSMAGDRRERDGGRDRNRDLDGGRDRDGGKYGGTDREQDDEWVMPRSKNSRAPGFDIKNLRTASLNMENSSQKLGPAVKFQDFITNRFAGLGVEDSGGASGGGGPGSGSSGPPMMSSSGGGRALAGSRSGSSRRIQAAPR